MGGWACGERWRRCAAAGRVGRRRWHGRGCGRGKYVARIRAHALEVSTDLHLKLLQRPRPDIELPLEIAAHLAFHLVDLAEGEHALADDGPGLVGVGVVADDLGGEHESGDEESVPGGPACGGEAGF